MIHLPLNAVAWSLGALAVYTFSVRSWRTYHLTQNPLARIYTVFGLTFGTALLFFGLPGLLSQNIHLLRYTYFLADLFVQISLQVALWLLWFLGLRAYLRLDYLYLVTVPFSAVLMTLQALTSQVQISRSPYLIIYTDRPVVLILKSVIYVVVAVPLGYFLLKQVPRQSSFKSKLKSFMAGMGFFIICAAATSNNIFDKGSDTQGSSAILCAFFVVLFLAQLLRPVSKPPRRRQR
ncbi:MAG TPA: hypothetical protein VHA37_08010 [Candidatus Saccharimonadales bacterium]|nr:hypothetical protein [Candidatus Saccharimonadales bacterium]